MSIRQQTRDRVQVARRIAIDGITATVTDSVLANEKFVSVGVIQPDSQPARSNESPRELDPYRISWADGYKGFPEALGAGWRLSSPKFGLLELLGPPEALREADRITGWSALAQLVSVLYPLTDSLQQQDGTELANDFSFAMWDETERQEAPARYEDYDAECPLDHQALVVVNNQISLDGVIYRISSTAKNLEGPRIVMTLRTQSRG